VAKATESAFATFLARSLELLLEQSPAHFLAVRRRMRGLSVRIAIDGEAPVRVQLDARPFVGPDAHADIVAGVARQHLAALLDGALTIEDAVDDDRLRLQGALDGLLSFLDALEAWIHGAVRCPAFPTLYREFLAGATQPGLPTTQS